MDWLIYFQPKVIGADASGFEFQQPDDFTTESELAPDGEAWRAACIDAVRIWSNAGRRG